MFGWFNNKLQPIAVDIGTDSIKVLQLEPRAESLHLLAAAVAEIPDELRPATKPRERDEFVVDALRKIFAKSAFKGKQAVTCLPASQMAVQHLRVSRMNDEELTKILPFELQGKVPFDPGRAVIRHVVAGEIYQENEAKMEVILMAAARENVERHLAIMDKAKLEVVGIHVEPNALIECFSHLYRRKGDENISTMYIDMGAGSTHVVIAHGKNMVFAKHIQIGGDTFNKRVAELIKQPFAQARQLRVTLTQQSNLATRLPAGVVAIAGADNNEHPLGSSALNGQPRLDAELADKASAALEEPTEVLVSELELCVRYYESVYSGHQIDRVIFVGGESRHVALCQQIARRLSLPATLGDPLARLVKDEKTLCDLDLRQPQPGWAIAVGLGMKLKGE